ncbi:MAG TPA: helix-turn-helix domain-containing protein, partial [Candidatus Eisenbacteria bacterium]|nr:helix-turn-helix domain-containing protein [Candidatus Eisenbacteria bacterium]
GSRDRLGLRVTRRSDDPEERNKIVDALRAHGGNQSEAARSLNGMKRTTLLYKMKKLDIRPEEYRSAPPR